MVGSMMPHQVGLPSFAEKVMCLKAGKPRSRLEDHWMESPFFGVQDFTDKVVTAMRHGVIKARMMKRLDGMQRIDADLVREMRGTPCDPIPRNSRRS